MSAIEIAVILWCIVAGAVVLAFFGALGIVAWEKVKEIRSRRKP
jgi:hypothetical protein